MEPHENHRLIICAFGLVLSSYALYVEVNKTADSSYEALCDINEAISCSAVFTSSYGTGLGLVQEIFGKESVLNQPNSLYGAIYFVVQASGAWMNDKQITTYLFWISLVAFFISVYLAYILIFVLRDICIVCVTTYVLSYSLHYLNKTARRRELAEAKRRNSRWYENIPHPHLHAE